MVYNTLEEVQKDFPDVKITEELDNSEWSKAILGYRKKPATSDSNKR
jgi:hypothetical protein